MKKKIIFTQRVDIIESYGERRDCADQKIAEFLSESGYLPIPAANRPEVAEALCEAIKPDGIFLTGGNDLADYGGNAPERDATETALLKYAIAKDIPLFGICRGMQFISHYFGCELQKVEGHIRKKHEIVGKLSREEVNSYHGMGIHEVNDELEELARTHDGVIEAIRHKEYRIMGVMWHPERVPGFSEKDIEMIRSFYA